MFKRTENVEDEVIEDIPELTPQPEKKAPVKTTSSRSRKKTRAIEVSVLSKMLAILKRVSGFNLAWNRTRLGRECMELLEQLDKTTYNEALDYLEERLEELEEKKKHSSRDVLESITKYVEKVKK